jgi:alpha-L-fucosidase 2
MNYWPAEPCNLAECHGPLLDAIDELVVSGRETARAHYGCRGWVLHHNFDLWRGTAPINASNHGIWITGGAWLCQHLWWHYQFGGDRQFLAQRAYPVMKEACLFFVDFLVPDPRDDRRWLISTPSNSPEIGGLVAGPTMDHQIIRDLLANTIRAGEILDVDAELRRQLRDLHQRIAPNQIGRFGQLQEWREDKDDPKNRHRHVSHLWGVFPGCEITPRATPRLCEAAQTSLRHRGDGGTGWSKAWKVGLWARFGDGDHAHRMLRGLISSSTYPNMMDRCPPFQIDGNFGGAAGMVEMLLQSHAGEIAILPALPSAWPTGRVQGLRARGGVEIDIAWNQGQARSVTLKATRGGTVCLRPPAEQLISDIVVQGEPAAFQRHPEDSRVQVEVTEGTSYELRFQ